jgi:VWFA-related protein
MRILYRSAAIVFASAAALHAGQAPPTRQDPPAPQAPVFRSSTNVVEVDVIVKDRDGRFVSGLTAADFELLEEGKPQRIEHLYLVSQPGRGPVEPAASIAGLPRGDDRSARRVFILVFDEDHLSIAALLKMRTAATAFIEAQFQPADLGGVYANGVLVNNRLTSNKAELLKSLRVPKPGFETSAQRTAKLREWPPIDGEFEASRLEAGDRFMLEDITTRVCEREPDECQRIGGPEYLQEALHRKAIEFIQEARRSTQRTLDVLQHATLNVARLEGRKTVALLSEGFFVEDVRGELPALAARAARAGITIYSINARGAENVGGRDFSDVTATGPGASRFGNTSEEGLDILAAETGGISIRRQDNFAAALNAVADDTSMYYVLGYSPTNPTLDGTFRRIQLKANWKGVTVRARRGYVATPLPPKQPPTPVK